MSRRLGISPSRTARLAAVAVVAVSVVSVGAARAEQRAAPAADAPYTLHVTALTGPRGADLMLDVAGDAGAAPVSVLKKVQLKIFTGEGKLDDVRNLDDVAAPAGKVTIPLGTVERGRKVEADVLVQPADTSRTYVLRGEAVTQLRPDLVVAAVVTQPQTTTSRQIAVTVEVAEANGDTGATGKVVIAVGETTLGPLDVTVGPGGRASVTFGDVSFPAPVPTTVQATVGEVAPEETDATNNAGATTVDVTEHELATPRIVLFPSLAGYGAQFGMHVYAPITPWPAGVPYGDFENKVKALEPHLVRIFYNDNWDGNAIGTHPEWPVNYASFVNVVRLAQEAGAIVDVSFQNLANAKSNPGPAMAAFADVLDDLVRNHGLTNVRWAEVGNEPNSPCTRAPALGGCPDPNQVTLEQYEALYRALDAQLNGRGLRSQIQLMGGGLVESAGARHHYTWMQWIATNMGDVVDGYAEHVYWTYNDSGRLEYRLRDTAHLMNEVLPPEQRKPTYMMEFGIRGFNTCVGKPNLPTANQSYYRDASCTDIWRTNLAGFHQLWFNVASAQLGVAGAAKWDAFWSRYDLSSANNQYFWTIGPPTEGSPLTPTYHALSLLFHTTVPGWQIVGVAPWDSSDFGVPTYGITGGNTTSDTAEKELAGYAGPNGELTLLGLDTNGRNLNGVSADPPAQYSIGGLPPNTNLTLAFWNASGDGTNSIAGTVPTNAAGVARFQVPLHAAFALTTLPAS